MRLSIPIYRLKRQAKMLSRHSNVPLNEALNNVAKEEGFENWSLLAARYADRSSVIEILNALNAGDLVLLGARPGHGKTLMGFELIAESIQSGNHAAFYSLEMSKEETIKYFSTLSVDAKTFDDKVILDMSDDICADYIIGQLRTGESTERH